MCSSTTVLLHNTRGERAGRICFLSPVQTTSNSTHVPTLHFNELQVRTVLQVHNVWIHAIAFRIFLSLFFQLHLQFSNLKKKKKKPKKAFFCEEDTPRSLVVLYLNIWWEKSKAVPRHHWLSRAVQGWVMKPDLNMYEDNELYPSEFIEVITHSSSRALSFPPPGSSSPRQVCSACYVVPFCAAAAVSGFFQKSGNRFLSYVLCVCHLWKQWELLLWLSY